MYELEESSGADHCKQFVVSCLVPGSGEHFRGEGESRKQAEQEAARHALDVLDNKHHSRGRQSGPGSS